MIPEDGGGADYSFPEKTPIHIATQYLKWIIN